MIKAVIVSCMDYRIQEKIAKIISVHNLNYGDYDLILIQGGAGNFEQLKSHLITSQKLHDPQKVILSIHQDCGYGAHKNNFVKALKITKEIFGNNFNICLEYITID